MYESYFVSMSQSLPILIIQIVSILIFYAVCYKFKKGKMSILFASCVLSLSLIPYPTLRSLTVGMDPKLMSDMTLLLVYLSLNFILSLNAKESLENKKSIFLSIVVLLLISSNLIYFNIYNLSLFIIIMIVNMNIDFEIYGVLKRKTMNQYSMYIIYYINVIYILKYLLNMF